MANTEYWFTFFYFRQQKTFKIHYVCGGKANDLPYVNIRLNMEVLYLTRHQCNYGSQMHFCYVQCIHIVAGSKIIENVMFAHKQFRIFIQGPFQYAIHLMFMVGVKYIQDINFYQRWHAGTLSPLYFMTDTFCDLMYCTKLFILAKVKDREFLQSKDNMCDYVKQNRYFMFIYVFDMYQN